LENKFMRKNIIIKFVLAVGCLLFIVSLTTTATAQIDTSSISAKLLPENPGPFDKVSIELISYNVDLGRADISWYVNGKLVLSGIGKTYYSFITGDVGSMSNINISIRSSSISTINKSVVIIPAEIDMLWEATDSYTPPFYKGKALASSESYIKITAVPNVFDINGNKIDPDNMIYSWKRDYKFEKLFNSQSGYGKKSVVFRRKLVGDNKMISVDASSFNGKITANSKVILGRFTPKIIFYQKHPLEGILYNNALADGFAMDEREATIVAEPYFFSSKNKDVSLLSYIWKLNNKEVDDTESEYKNEIVLRADDRGGMSKISLNIKNVSKILQFVSNSFNVSF